MKGRTILLIIFAATVLCILNSCINKNLKSKEIQLAEQISGLNLPVSLHATKLVDHYGNLHGDVFRNVEFILTDNQVDSITRECIKKKYNKLPILDREHTPIFVSKNDNGYYYLIINKDSKFDYDEVIFIINKKILYLESIQ